MALDEPRENDENYNIDGFEYIVDKDFLEKAKPIRVDFSGYGFRLESGYDFSSACSSCGTKGGCCS